MIHKYLFVNKTVFLSSIKLEDERPGTTIVELLVPIKVYWSMTEMLQRANFLLASGEQMAEIQGLYRKIFKEAAPYAVFENDRVWLFRNAGMNTGGAASGPQQQTPSGGAAGGGTTPPPQAG